MIKRFRIWNSKTGEQIGQPLEGHSGPVLDVTFSPDGKRILSASKDRTARVWDATTGKQVGQFNGHRSRVNSVAFSPNGDLAVTASDDMTARLWNTKTGEPVGPALEGHTDDVSSARFSPDGNLVVTASSDDTVRVWNVSNSRQIGEPLKAKGVRGANFSPDGKRIVSTSGAVWDVETRTPVADLAEPDTEVWSAVYSPDGMRIVTASPREEVPVRLWTIYPNTQELIAHAKTAAPRCLTVADRISYFLQAEPPSWCIDLQKWPYSTRGWKQWLADKQSGKSRPMPDDLSVKKPSG